METTKSDTLNDPCVWPPSGHPEPHAGFPQHFGLSRLDGLGRRLPAAAEEGAGLGLGFHLGA